MELSDLCVIYYLPINKFLVLKKKMCNTSIFEAKEPLKGKMNAKSTKTELLAGDRDLGMGTVIYIKHGSCTTFKCSSSDA